MTEVPHPDAPTDDEGHPVHPEGGHRICAGIKSDRTSPTEHGRERDDYPFCLQRAGWGRDAEVGPCRTHRTQWGYTGEDNPAYEHGAYSEHLRHDLTDSEVEMLDGIVEAFGDPESATELMKHQAAEAYVKFKRSGDQRFLREYRQLVETFNLAPNEERVALSGDVEHSVELDSETAAAIREATLDDE